MNRSTHIKDACELLNIDGNIYPERVKKAYRQACLKYHPDRGGSHEMMQLVNLAYASLKDYTGKVSISDQVKDYGNKLNAAINAINTLDLTIEVCGAWIWVSGDTKAHKEILKQHGYQWAPKKQKWYYRPKDYKSFARGGWSMDKIRDEYGSQLVDAISPKAIARG